MPPRPARALAWGLGAVLLYLAFKAGTEWSDGYLMHYGSFLPSTGELAFKLHLLLFVLPATLLMAAACAHVDRIARRVGAWFDSLSAPAVAQVSAPIFALLALSLAALVRAAVLRGTAVTDDENVYLFQARLLAAGRLHADSLPEPLRAFFDNQFIINNGRWFGMYFVGHPLVLALALKTGLLEWVGPLEAALTLLVATGIARRLFGPRAAWLTGLLLAGSPFFIFVSATHLSQPTSTLALALVIYGALRIEESPRAVRWWALAAGSLSVCLLARPQVAVLLAVPVLARPAFLATRNRLRPGWAPVLTGGLILGVGAAVFLAVNHALTGDILRTSYHAYWERFQPYHLRTGLLYPVREISQNLAQLNFWLFGWPLSLAFLPFFRRTGRAWVLAAIPLIALLAQGLAGVPTVALVGPVYYAETIVPLVILSASGLERAVEWARQRLGDGWPARALVAWPWVSIVLSTLLAFVPVEVASLRLMADIARAPYDLVEERGLDHAVVFVHSLPALHRRPGAWVYYHRNNSPDLSDPVLFVRDLGPERNTVLMDYLPNRAPYLMGMREGELVLIPLRP